MRISDWSSDVCSSDLLIDAVKFHQLDVVSTRHRTSDAVEQAFCDGAAQIIPLRLHGLVPAQPIKWLRNIPATVDYSVHINPLISKRRAGSDDPPGGYGHSHPLLPAQCRSEERRVGEECVSTCRYR